MSIVSSTYKTWDAWNGFVHVEERHTDSTGAVHFFSYTAPTSLNIPTRIAEHATSLATQLAEAETDQVIA